MLLLVAIKINCNSICFLLGRYSITKAFCIAFVMTFFSVFDVPVFWPILLFYWLVLFTLTMRRQIMHMIKYKYVPFTFGKQVLYNLLNFKLVMIRFCAAFALCYWDNILVVWELNSFLFLSDMVERGVHQLTM